MPLNVGNDAHTQESNQNDNNTNGSRDSNQPNLDPMNPILPNFNLQDYHNNVGRMLLNAEIQRDISAFIAANSRRHDPLLFPQSQISGIALL
jgi:hypothetical protein